MDYKRIIRFEYFEVVARRLDQNAVTPDLKFDLQNWIDVASKLSLEGRTFDYYAEQARMDKFWYEESKNYWFMSFIRLRETNLPMTAYLDKEAVPINLDDDEYIGEEANSLYDNSTGVLMLQRNKFSLGVSGLEHYINLLWKDRGGLKICLRPILVNNVLGMLNKPGIKYRKFTVRFADIKESAIKRLRPKSGFIDFYENLKKYSAVNAEITITVGNSKNDCLDNETVSETIEEIMENKDIIKRAEIGVKYDNESVETLDLFSNMVHDFITFKLNKKESLSSEYTASEMSETFNNRKGILMDILRKG